MTTKAPATTMPSTSAPAATPPTPFAWSWTYDGPVESADDPTCDMCLAVRAKKCLKGPLQHGAAGPNPACVTCQAAKVGYCHNHHGVAASLAQHPNEHTISDAHRPTFDAASQWILALVAALPKDTKRVYIKAEATQNHELTAQSARIEIASWR
jgi:hypothetical protein